MIRTASVTSGIFVPATVTIPAGLTQTAMRFKHPI
jgi:hypothetical protein